MQRSNVRHRVALIIALSWGGWFGCGSGEKPAIPDEAVASIQVHLDADWDPSKLTAPAAAWFVADPGTQYATVESDGAVSRWKDQSGHGRDVTQPNSYGSPRMVVGGWNSTHPTLHFRGNDLLWTEDGSVAPAGASTGFSVFAVLRSTDATQASAVAGFWPYDGSGYVWAGLSPSNGQSLPQLMRTYGLGQTQIYDGPHDVGSGTNQRHVVIWSYSPGDQRFKVTLDGTTKSSTSMPALQPLSAMPFIVGAKSLLPTGQFVGDLSELVVTSGMATDDDIANFTAYARNRWGDLPTSGSADPCVNADLSNATTDVRCDDLDPATVGDHCNAGICVGSAPLANGPASFSPGPVAWYHAGANEVVMADGRVAKWFDRTANHHDLVQGFYNGRPTLAAQGWHGDHGDKPTIQFAGGQAMRNDAWSGEPTGSNEAFSVLAVMRLDCNSGDGSCNAGVPNVGLASWWSPVGYGRVTCQLAGSSGGRFPELLRTGDFAASQTYTVTDASEALGPDRHVVVWSLGSNAAHLTVDGVTQDISSAADTGYVTPAYFLLGTASDFASVLLRGDVSELAVIPRAVTQQEINGFRNYAEQEWGGLTTCTPSCAGNACVPDGCGGTCPCGGAGGPCTLDNQCPTGYKCGSGLCGGAGAECGQCGPGLTCVDGACQCVRQCEGKTCGAADGCDGTCTCGTGEPGCTDDSQCDDQLFCINGTCAPGECSDDPVAVGCGYPGAPCGPCTLKPTCTSDADCTAPQVCGVDDGWRYGVPALRVCEDPSCQTDPQTAGCGTEQSPCGLCPPCQANCAGKQCGDTDLADGCGATCTGLCDPGASCNVDTDCAPGDVCLLVDQRCTSGICARVCLPANPCLNPNLAPPDCGSATAVCGPTCPMPVRADGSCQDRVCGTDPFVGIACGSCGAGEFCTGAGQCAPLAADAPIQVPAGPGPNPPVRTVLPQPSPAAVPIDPIPGQFGVNDRGSFTYSIPIDVPPGRAGLQPHLALSYASSAENGMLGVGWHVDGLSAIVACNKTYAQDGAASVPKGFDPSLGDAYCLDGQRLVPIAPSSGAGLEFRTAVDTFSKITADLVGDGTVYSFTVLTKDGSVLTYGGYPGSALARVKEGQSQFHTYALAKIADRAGNFVRFTYWQLPSNDGFGTAEMLPDTVTYTGFGDKDGDREVLFHYQDRSDFFVGYGPGGVSRQRSKLLQNIEVRAQGALVRRYEMTYDTGANQSHLTRVTEGVSSTPCSEPGSLCLPPTVFEYNEDTGLQAKRQIVAPITTFTTPFGQSSSHQAVPIGLVHRWAPGDTATGLQAQLGLDSALVRRADRVSMFTGGGGISTVSQPIPGWVGTGLTIAGAVGGPAATAVDLVVGFINSIFSSDDPPTVYYSAYGYSPLFKPNNLLPEYATDSVPSMHITLGPTGGEPIKDGNLFGSSQSEGLGVRPAWIMDLDGDGVPDKLYCTGDLGQQTGVLAYALANARQKPASVYPNTPFNATVTDATGTIALPFAGMCRCNAFYCPEPSSLQIDLDGDGVSNFMVYDPDTQNWSALFLTPTGFQWNTDAVAGLDTKLSPNRQYIVPMDVNGDGLRDLLAIGNRILNTFPFRWTVNPSFVAINTGLGFDVQPLTGEDPSNQSEGALIAPAVPPFVVDLDHDGKEELLEMSQPGEDNDFYVPTQWHVRRVSDNVITRDSPPDLVTGYGSMGDFDGDGDIDLLTLSPDPTHTLEELRLGTGRLSGMLTAVTDGAGHRVEVGYDVQVGTDLTWQSGLENLAPDFDTSAPTDATCRWPYRCSEQVPTIVSSVVEKHSLDRAGTQVVTDRSTRYHYKGTREDVAGYGWLGFWERSFTTSDRAGNTLDDTSIVYEPPQAWNPDTSAFPYVLPIASLPRQTVSSAPDSNSAATGLTAHLEKTEENTWVVASSSAGRPFPELTTQNVTLAVVSASDSTERTIVSERLDTRQTDSYGNLYHLSSVTNDIGPGGGVSATTSRDETYDVTPSSDRVAAWLIGLVNGETVIQTPRCVDSDCADATRTRYTTYEYYPNGLLHFVHRQPGDPNQELDTEYVRDDPYGNVTGMFRSTYNQGIRRETEYGYDSRGLYRLSSTEVGEGQDLTSQFRYDDRFGTVSVQTDPNGIDSTSSYDELGKKRVQTGPQGEVHTDYAVTDFFTASDVVASGLPIESFYRMTTTGVGGPDAQTDEEYNSFGHIVRRARTGSLEPDVVFEEFAYDFHQNLSTRTRPHLASDATQSASTYLNDTLGRPLRETGPDGSIVIYDYAFTSSAASAAAWQVPGALTAVSTSEATGAGAPALQKVAVKSSDDKVLRVVDGLGQTTDYAYGAFGEQRKITDPAGRVIQFVHDEWSRQLSSTDDARGGTETAVYDGFDEVTQTADAADHERSYFYDSFGRVEHTTDDDGTTQWFYDGDGSRPNELGRPIQVVTPSGQSTSYAYEAPTSDRNRGLLVTETRHVVKPSDASVTRDFATDYQYDDFGNVSRVDYPAAFGTRSSVTYVRDGFGNVTQLRDTNNPTQCLWRLVASDEGYRVKQARIGAACTDDAGGSLTTYQREPLSGRLVNVSTTRAGSTLQDVTYSYDLASRVTGKVDAVTNRNETYKYDALSRLTHINNTERYVYDADGMGRLTSLKAADGGVHAYDYQSQGRDWIHHAGPWSYTQDSVGNVATRSGPGVSQSFTYTPIGLPRTITSNGNVTTFDYGADNKRVVKQEPSLTTFYGSESHQLVEKLDGTQFARIMISAGGNPIAQIQTSSSGATTIRYLYEDAIGTVVTTTHADGSVEGQRDYTPFGEAWSTNSGLDQVPYGFTGQEEDSALGLVNMNARLYDPELGQFLAADPVIADPTSQGLNRFAYVNNSPLDFTDPSGMRAKRTSFGDIFWGVAEGTVLAYIGGYLGASGNSPWLDQASFLSDNNPIFNKSVHGAINGALAGYRHSYSFDFKKWWDFPMGTGAFILDSTNGITGTALSNVVNIYDTAGTLGDVHYSYGLSERQNRQVFTNSGFGFQDFAHTQGGVISNLDTKYPSLLNHETEHVWANRLFGASYQATYFAWSATLGTAVVGTDLMGGRNPFKDPWVKLLAYYWNPWEQAAYCRNPSGYDSRLEGDWFCSAPHSD